MEQTSKPKKSERLDTKVRKRLFLEALERSMGIQTPALKAAGNLSPETVRQWRLKDPKFAKEMENCQAVCGDFVESKLLQKIKDGDTAAIIFFCKTKLRHRGYAERTEITGRDGKDLMPARVLTKKEAKDLLCGLENEY